MADLDAAAPRSPLQRWTDFVTVGSFRTGTALARVVPAFVADGLVAPIGLGANFANVERRAMVERHMRRVDPSLRGWALRQAVQGAFDSYTRYWIDCFRLPSLPARHVARSFTLDGFDQVTDRLTDGRGVILALPHLGGWEWAGRWLADVGHLVTVVVERLDPPELFEWFVGLREELGMKVVPLGPGAGKAVLRALADNEIVCLLCDRDIQGGGVEVEFFGERTTLPAGPATMALRSGAPVMPVAVYFTSKVDGHHAKILPPVPADRAGRLRDDVTAMTQRMAWDLERLIRRAPSQWHLFQPNWPSDPGYGS